MGSESEARSVGQAWRRWLPIAIGLLVSWGGVQLGMWQLRRADYKDGLQLAAERMQGMAPHTVDRLAALREGERVRVSGRWLSEHGIWLDNQPHGKRVGYHFLMPLQIAERELLLVNRGWLLAAQDRSLPTMPATAGETIGLEGSLIAAEQAGYVMGEVDANAPRWPRNALAAWQQRLPGWQIAPLILRQESAAEDGLVRDWPVRDFGADKHRGYAFQWFSLATLALGLSIYGGAAMWRAHRRRNAENEHG